MPALRSTAGGRNVFLNVPFDPGYEKLLVAAIASVVAARLLPRCAVEIPERGDGQLKRIFELLKGCPLSIHDLSRADRLNMPFELGLAVALNQYQRHEYIILESRPHRLARRLSDLRIEPLVHGNGPLKLIAVLSDNLGSANPRDVETIYRRLVAVLPRLKRRLRLTGAYERTIFKELVSGAAELAEQLGFYRE